PALRPALALLLHAGLRERRRQAGRAAGVRARARRTVARAHVAVPLRRVAGELRAPPARAGEERPCRGARDAHRARRDLDRGVIDQASGALGQPNARTPVILDVWVRRCESFGVDSPDT